MIRTILVFAVLSLLIFITFSVFAAREAFLGRYPFDEYDRLGRITWTVICTGAALVGAHAVWINVTELLTWGMP